MASFKGLNGAPAWSPDGLNLALALSKDGNTEIYIRTLKSGKMRRLTYHKAIDTEPAWTPNGEEIIFTSDRGGHNRPQLYAIPSAGGKTKRIRISPRGTYNSHPTISPDGKLLAMVHGENGKYHIGLIDMDDGILQVMTQTWLDESPTFSPNGNMIIYATHDKNQGILSVVSVDGKAKNRLMFKNGEVREPAWAPYYSN